MRRDLAIANILVASSAGKLLFNFEIVALVIFDVKVRVVFVFAGDGPNLI